MEYNIAAQMNEPQSNRAMWVFRNIMLSEKHPQNIKYSLICLSSSKKAKQNNTLIM